MKFFNAVAGNSRYGRICLDLAKRRGRRVFCPLLFSVAYLQSCSDLWEYLDRGDLILDHLMIDSGAVSVASKGIDIDLEKYAYFIHCVRDNPLVR